MHVLIVYGSTFGTTRALAETIGAAMGPDHSVQVIDQTAAEDAFGMDVDLLLVGAPTQLHGFRLLGRRFLANLRRRAFADVAAAAFDTRMPGPVRRTGAASDVIARGLEAGGCRLVVPPESFIVVGREGPLAEGEEARAIAWARTVLAAASRVAS